MRTTITDKELAKFIAYKLETLPMEERIEILRIAELLRKQIKARNQSVYFGEASALELLFKLATFLNQKKVFPQ